MAIHGPFDVSQRALDDLMELIFKHMPEAGGELWVPRALLETCLALLEEANKQVPITGSNFDDDMAMALGQLRTILSVSEANGPRSPP